MSNLHSRDTLSLLVTQIRRVRRMGIELDAEVLRDLFFGALVLGAVAHRLSLSGCNLDNEGIRVVQSKLGFEIPLLNRSLRRSLEADPSVVARICTELREVFLLCADDPLLIGWCYQLWNAPERDRSTWAISRKEVARSETSSVAAATQIFTEEYMVECLIGRAFALHAPRPLEDFEICDPACGAGHFLVGCLRAVVARMSRSQLEDLLPTWIVSAMYGFDIDREVVELCRTILLIESLRYLSSVCHETWRALEEHIIVVDGPHGSLDRDSREPLLHRTYRCVATNPPYLGRRKASDAVRVFLDETYPDTSLDLCAAFMQRCVELTAPGGILLLVTIDKWLRLKGYAPLRTGGVQFKGLYNLLSLEFMAELGSPAFRPQLELHAGVGIVLTAGVKTDPERNHLVQYLQLHDAPSLEERKRLLLEISPSTTTARRLSLVPQDRFRREDSSRIFAEAAGISGKFLESSVRVETRAAVVVGLQTNDDRRFVKYFWEVQPDPVRWRVHSRGGGYVRWYGLNRWILDWGEGRTEFTRSAKSGLKIEALFDEVGWTYTWFANGCLGLRVKEAGWSFGRAAASGVFTDDPRVIAVLNARIGSLSAQSIGGKVQLPEGVVRALPLPRELTLIDRRLVIAAVHLSKLLSQQEPTEISFGASELLSPREVLATETVLLLIEGILEEQVLRAMGAMQHDRDSLDERLLPPVGMGAATISEAWSTLRHYLPSSLRNVLEPVQEAHTELFPVQSTRKECGTFDHSLSSLFTGSASMKKVCRYLPPVTRMERLAREKMVHPLDLFHHICQAWDGSDMVRRVLQAPCVRTMILYNVLELFSHSYWFSPRPIRENPRSVLSLSEIVNGIEARWETSHGAILPLQQVELTLGETLYSWMYTKFFTWHSKAFFGVPLIIHTRRTGTDTGVFQHRWDAEYSTALPLSA